MKIKIIWTILILMSLAVFTSAQEKEVNNIEKGKITASAEQVNTIFLAFQAAKYGRANKSPDALIFAASVLRKIPGDKIMLEKEIEGGQPDTQKKTNKPNQTADVFLNEAKVLAGKDKFLLGRIKAVAQMRPDVRGSEGGPKRANTDVKAFGTDVITLRFKGGENAVVTISGDGDTDLDLFVYDENGTLIASDTGGSDNCRVRFFPKKNGIFKIKVKNLGNVYNHYQFSTN